MADPHHHSMAERAQRCVFLAALLGCQTHVASGFSSGGTWGFTKTGATRTRQQHDEVATFNHRSHHQSFTYRPRKLRLKAEALAEDTPTQSSSRSSSLATSEGRERGEDQFERWATQAGIKAPKLRHEVFPDALVGDLRGLKAVEATSKSEQLATVPAKAAISLAASESTPFKSWVSPDFWDSQQWYVKLALKLLWERQLGAASAVEGYVNVLPAQGTFETLVHWTDQELDMLKYPKCAASAKRQRATWDKLHESLLARCPDGAGRAVKRDDLVWAMECVLSRAFNGRFGGGQNSAFLSGGLAVAAGAAYALTEQPVWVLLAALALLPLTLPELGSLGAAVTGKESKADDYVLVPFVDSMNHITTATTELSFSPVSGGLSVSVNRGYGEGEQVYISYGRKSNDELLQFYGFVEADCPADTFVVENIAEKLELPVDRIRAVADAGQRAALEEVIICRGPDVVSEETVEGLRVLLATETGETGGGDGAIWRALRTTCETELASVQISSAAEEKGGGSVRERLALAFRREKASVLAEAIRNLEKRVEGG